MFRDSWMKSIVSDFQSLGSQIVTLYLLSIECDLQREGSQVPKGQLKKQMENCISHFWWIERIENVKVGSLGFHGEPVLNIRYLLTPELLLLQCFCSGIAIVDCLCMDLRKTLQRRPYSLKNLAAILQILILLFKIIVHNLIWAEIWRGLLKQPFWT